MYFGNLLGRRKVGKKGRKAGKVFAAMALGPTGLILRKKMKQRKALKAKLKGMSPAAKKALKKSLLKKKLKRVGAFALLAPLGPAAGIAAAIAKRRKARRKASAKRTALTVAKVPGFSPAPMAPAYSPAPSTRTNRLDMPREVFHTGKVNSMEPVGPDYDPDVAEDIEQQEEDEAGADEEDEARAAARKPQGLLEWIFSGFGLLKPAPAVGW
jgi:hypothetical protein